MRVLRAVGLRGEGEIGVRGAVEMEREGGVDEVAAVEMERESLGFAVRAVASILTDFVVVVDDDDSSDRSWIGKGKEAGWLLLLVVVLLVYDGK